MAPHRGSDAVEVFDGLDRIDVGAGFVDPAAGDYHLDSSSPAVDVGSPALLDADASPADLGAYGGAGL